MLIKILLRTFVIIKPEIEALLIIPENKDIII